MSSRVDDAAPPSWVVVDATGLPAGQLHEVRAFPGVRKVLVLLSSSTPQSYRESLLEHGYPSYTSGDRHVDLGESLRWLGADRGVTDVLVDGGPTLTSVLLAGHLVEMCSCSCVPWWSGRTGRHMFGELTGPAALETVRPLQQGRVVRLRYHRPGPGGSPA